MTKKQRNLLVKSFSKKSQSELATMLTLSLESSLSADSAMTEMRLAVAKRIRTVTAQFNEIADMLTCKPNKKK